jgi:monovalent cation:H+ antiporter-2, CPA2 family
VLFFVSVGMLFDPYVLISEPVHVLGVVAIIVVGKSLAAVALVLLMRYPLHTALTISASLAQIGEFSFILVGLGAQLGLMPDEGHSLVLAGALISIAINPLLFKAIEPLREVLRQHSPLIRRLEARDDPLAELPRSTEAKYLSRQVVLVGYGRVGRRIAQALKAAGQPFVVADQNREVVEALRAKGMAAVVGNAGEPEVLIQAHIAQARMLVIATQDTLSLHQMIETARTLNPEIQIVVRSHNEDEAERLRAAGVGTVFLGEAELAHAMARHVLAPPPLEKAH